MIDRLHLLLLQMYRHLPVGLRRAIVRAVTPSYSVGAICFTERSDGRILLVRQSYKDGWGAPGGLLKRGEAPETGAIREVFEEVGLAVESVGEPVVVVEPHIRRIDVVYRTRPVKGADPDAARPASVEITGVGWFARDELPELQEEAAQALVALARSSGPIQWHSI